MTINELKELAMHAARGTAPSNFSNENVNEALADALKEFGNLRSSINDFQRNKYDIFDIIIENVDLIAPKKVIDTIGRFAEVQVVAQGDRPLFKTAIGKNRARKFLTQVGLSGVYETFRLDKRTFSIDTHAVGGAVTMDFERFLDGAESLSELMDVITTGLTDAIYNEVQKALVAAINASDRPAANKYSDSVFVASEMQKLITTVRSYGDNVVIFACPEFIDAMGPDAIVPAISGAAQGIYAPSDIEDIHMNGRVRIFRGVPIVEIPQSFVDESNQKTWINPQYAYILPAGAEKVVKVVLEGQTQMWDEVNKDQSIEINAYKKMGAAILTHYNWAVYRNTGVTDNSYNPYGF